MIKQTKFHVDLLICFALFFILFLLKAYNKPALNDIVIIVFTALILFSSDRRELFWVSFTFIYASNPAGLFYNYTFGINLGQVVVDFSQILTIILFIKVLRKRLVYPLFFNRFLWILSGVIILNVLNGFSNGLGEIRILFRVVKLLLPFSFIYIALIIYKTDEDFKYFFSMIFPFVIIGFVAQLLVYFLGITPAIFLYGKEIVGAENVLGGVLPEEQLSRYVFSIGLQSVALMGCLFYLASGRSKFNKIYLSIILFLCFFSVLLSGTRGWTIGFGTAILLWSIFSVKRIKGVLISGITITLLYFLIIKSFPVVGHQLQFAINRINTVELLAKGDLSAGGTVQRFTERGPIVMSAFRETNQIFGAGYSKYYFDHQDGHVGHQNLLLQSGYLGYILLNSFILYLIFKLIYQYFKSPKSYFNEALLAAGLILIGLYLIFIGLAIFSYLVSPEWSVVYGLILAFAGYYYYKSKSLNHQNKELH